MLAAMRRAVLIFAALPLAWALPAAAQAPSAAPPPSSAPAAASPIDALVTTLTNMGYEPTKKEDKQLTVKVGGTYNATATLRLMNNGQLQAYVYLDKYSAGEMSRLNLIELMLASDAGPSYVSLEKSSDVYTLYVNWIIPATAATPPVLRTLLTNLAEIVDQTAQYWDKAKWKS